MEHLREGSATAQQSEKSSDRELMEAWKRAKERAAVEDGPGLVKADFSSLLPALAAKTGRAIPTEYDPWTMDQMRANSYNAIEQAPDGTGWNCPACKNKELIYDVVANPDGSPRLTARVCKCQEIRRTIRRMQRSGLENIISDNLFSKYETPDTWQQTIKAAAMEYAKTFRGWFWIGGQSGSGKSHLCTAICRDAIYKGMEVVYMMWREDAPRLKAAVNSEEYPAMVDQYKKAPVLYIDDLFKTGKDNTERVKPTSADVNLAFEIINFRCVGKLPTIISSEFLQRELIDIDEALTGRIVQMAGENSFNIKPDRAKNYRLKGMVEL